MLYDEIGIRDKAISTYEKAAIRNDADGIALIVGTSLPPNPVLYSVCCTTPSAYSCMPCTHLPPLTHSHTRILPPPLHRYTVDSYDLTEDEGFKRRMERMSDGHRKAYLAKRAALRGSLLFAEEERQVCYVLWGGGGCRCRVHHVCCVLLWHIVNIACTNHSPSLLPPHRSASAAWCAMASSCVTICWRTSFRR